LKEIKNDVASRII